jgi:RND family efflux transporter MFP subunit
MPTPSQFRLTPFARLLRSRRALAVPLVAMVLGVGAFTVYGSASSRSAPAPRPIASVTVELVAPMPSKFTRSIAATGTVAARDELVIGSDATGVRLLEVLVDVGSTVTKGQLLARGDDATLRAQLAQMEAQIRQAQAELTQADSNVERSERIRDSGVYSVETLQTRQTTAMAARAKLELAVAQKRELEIRIAQTRVLAPANGVIAKKAATVGAVVQPGTELFRLIRDGEIEWLAELPSHSLTRVRAGVPVRVHLDDGSALDATARQVAPTIDAATRNGLVYVTLPRGAALKPGAHARGEILLASSEALSLPETAVMTRDGYPFVYVVGGDGVARLRRIETGARQRGLVEVTGLGADARVVSTGAGFVKDGEIVRLASDAPADSKRPRDGQSPPMQRSDASHTPGTGGQS